MQTKLAEGIKEGKNAIYLGNLGKLCQLRRQGRSFMLSWSAASKIIYVRPVGSPKDTLKGGKILTLIIQSGPLDPHPSSLPEFYPRMTYGTFFCSDEADGTRRKRRDMKPPWTRYKK